MKILNILKFAKKNAPWAITLVLWFAAISSNAQTEKENTGMMMVIVGIVAVVSVLVLFVALYTLQVLKQLLRKQQGQEINIPEKPSLWKWLIYITIILSGIYLVGYYFIGGGQLKESEAGVANDSTEAKPSAEVIAEEIVPEADAESDAGKAVYDMNCAACHTADGGGIMGLGPNLADKYWKNSNGSKEGVRETITNGVADTAMMAWAGILDETQIKAVTNYVLAFQGTTPANPKEPEGDLYE